MLKKWWHVLLQKICQQSIPFFALNWAGRNRCQIAKSTQGIFLRVTIQVYWQYFASGTTFFKDWLCFEEMGFLGCNVKQRKCFCFFKPWYLDLNKHFMSYISCRRSLLKCWALLLIFFIKSTFKRPVLFRALSILFWLMNCAVFRG